MRRGSSVYGHGWGLAVGGVVTALLLVLYLAGALDRLALTFLDINFRHFNRVEASDRILLIDVDDYAVERIHRWPWPRRLHAELVATLNELGADLIVMDFVFPEPMPPRVDAARFHKDYDVDPVTEVVGEPSEDDWIRDDDELADALQHGGNVYLSMYYRYVPPDRPVDEFQAAAADVFRTDVHAGPQTFRRALPYDPGDRLERLYQRYRMRHLLLQDFTLTREALAERLDTPIGVIDKYLAGAKRLAARERVRAVLDESPGATFEQVLADVLPEGAGDTFSADREDVKQAYRSIKGWRNAVAGQPLVPESLRGRIEQAEDVTPPLGKLADAARGVGFVTFDKDFDGVLRGVPLVVDAEGHLIKQLGFAAACDLLEFDDERMRLQGGWLVLSDADGQHAFRVPIDRQGRTLLNWHLDRDQPSWEHSFNHLPVSAIMQIVFNRRAIAENQARYGIAVAEAVRATQEPVYPQYAEWVRRRNEIRKRLRYLQGRRADERPKLVQELDDLDEKIGQVDRTALDALKLFAGQIEGAAPTSPEEEELFERITSSHELLVRSGQRQRWEAANARAQAHNAELIEDLGPRVAGKICFVGYTATATPDLVNTPVYDTVPGVLGHANVVNSFLQGGFPRVASRTMNVLLIVLAGALVTLVTARRSPSAALVCVLLTVALLMLFSFVLFWGGAVYVAAVVPALTVFVCWAFITLYRQFVEQRAKRQFSRALAQYTSPAVAARIAEQQGAQDLSPRPCEVTCFFSDLKGFTAISERLGAERTRAILNPYLETMSQVLNEHRAIINKFMGDGIFAFFNPPILQVPEHARAACAAALDSMTALEALRTDLTQGLGSDAAALHMRVGINS
ncbi:MAG TPA: CHASE2 domain-containing protein, partial [Phycisphaerae bacterium]|nr:CHASE2 domain-containing protein [Phycisphaerae bacterium]